MLYGLRCIATHHLSRKCDYVTFALGHKRVKRLTLQRHRIFATIRQAEASVFMRRL